MARVTGEIRAEGVPNFPQGEGPEGNPSSRLCLDGRGRHNRHEGFGDLGTLWQLQGLCIDISLLISYKLKHIHLR
jgi:hypothetical protein